VADIRVTGASTQGINPSFLRAVTQAARLAGATSINIDSGYRSPAYNASVGGVPHSNHITGLAVDGTAYIPGQGDVPLGDLPTLGMFNIRSGDQPGFYHGSRDAGHVDAGYEATGYSDPRGTTTRNLASANGLSGVAALIYQLAPRYGIDPRAALAVAQQEGLGGGVGDQGTSFGPFQLHYGGAYPSSAPRGQAASQAWAQSPAGVGYALSQMGGAKGLTGNPAIRKIVYGFERPADPASEYNRAVAAYGQTPSAAAAPSTTTTTMGAPSLAGFTTLLSQMMRPPMPNPYPAAAQTLAAIKPPKVSAPTESAAPVPSSVPGVPNALSYYNLVQALRG